MKKLILLALVLVVIVICWGAWWLLYTSSGARFVIGSLSRFDGFEVRVGAITGRLADVIELRDTVIRLRNEPVTVLVRDIRLSWRPAGLIRSVIAIDRLDVHGVGIDDNRPPSPSPPDLTWPRISNLPATITAWIREFHVEDVRYRLRGTETLSIDRIKAAVAWHHGMLSAGRLVVESPVFTARGTVKAGFLTPLVRADLAVLLPGTTGTIQSVKLVTDLKEGKGTVQLRGIVTAQALMEDKATARMEGLVAVLKHEIALSDLKVAHSDFAGSLTGSASVLLTAAAPVLRVDAVLHDVGPAARKSGQPAITGSVQGAGTISAYKGTFELAVKPRTGKGKPWGTGSAAGTFSGDDRALALHITAGRWLGGAVTGTGTIGWQDGLHVSASMRATDLQPTYVSPDWQGDINMDASLNVTRSAKSGLSGSATVVSSQSTLRGRPFSADVRLDFDRNLFRLTRLTLQGRGFDIQAAGTLAERIDYRFTVSDLAGLVPDTEGALVGAGWVRYRDGRVTGSLAGKGSAIEARQVGVRAVQFSAALANNDAKGISLDVDLQGLAYGRMRADHARVTVRGTTGKQAIAGEISAGTAYVYTLLEGGLQDREWRGAITQLRGRDTSGTWGMESPAPLLVSARHVAVETLRLHSSRGEAFRVSGDVFLDPPHGSVDMAWSTLDVGRVQPFLAKGTIRGTTTGQVLVRWPEGASRRVEAKTELEVEYTEGTLAAPVKGNASAYWDARGLAASWTAALGGGRASGRLTAAGPPDFRLPEQATLAASWEGMRLDLLHAWFPPDMAIKGLVSGKINGTLAAGGVVNVAGQTEITQGALAYRPGNGVVTTAIESAFAKFAWRGRSLDGQLALALGTYGKAEGTFSLPLPARLPAAFTRDGPVSVRLRGEVREQGLISALLPGIVQEAKGVLAIDARANGTWQQPRFSGAILLKDAGAYLPAAGIRLEKVRAEATLEGDTVHVRQLRAESGGGWIEAAGDMEVRGGRFVRYQGNIRGDAFQLLNLPDIRAFASPRITFQGDPKLLSARGEVTIPRMTIYGRIGENVVRPSPDIVIVDATAPRKKTLPVGLDIQIHVILGEKVSVVTSGIDARLAGAVDVNVAGIDAVTARGKIRVVDGGYRAYGVRLAITRGNITFVGPVDRPVLDILAVRKSDDVTAGVEVSGTARSPVVTLYSNPPMSESDKLAYIVLGHRVTQTDSSQSSAFLATAGMFEGGATPTAASEARRRLGIEALGAQEEAARSALSIGRYLAPGFYVSIGRSLLTNENLVTLRYTLSKNWEVESRLGGATGMDLFYRIEFE